MFALPRRYVLEAFAILVCIACAMMLLSMRHASLVQNAVSHLDERIALERESLRTLHGLSLNNQLADELRFAAHPCTVRDQYEERLAELTTSSPLELREARELLALCGTDGARARALMVLRMEDHVGRIEEMLAIREVYTSRDTYRPWVETWRTAIDLERTRAEHMFEQVALQELIIEALLTKGDLTEPLTRARDLAQILDVQAKEARSAVVREEDAWRGVVAE